MLRVVIAEDEKYVRKGIVNRIDWHALGFAIAGEAETGTQALELVRAHDPAVLITDIRMPYMDGISVIQALRMEGFQTRCIIISGYGDFQYAQTAIRLNVTDYLTKPIVVEELRLLLARIRTEIEGEGEAQAPVPPEGNDQIETIRKYIHRNYAEDITGQGLAERFFISPSYLSHCFKQRMGIGISQYLEKVRIERAKALMRAGYRAKKAGEMVGYTDASYFTRVFKRSMGLTPTQYARQHGGEGADLTETI